MEIYTNPGEIIDAVLISENEKRQTKKEIEPFAELEAIRKKEDQKRISTEEKKVSDFERSRVASEKLRLAWMKANITFIGLGFAVYKFYQSRLTMASIQ